MGDARQAAQAAVSTVVFGRDGLTLVGDRWDQPDRPRGCVLLLHGIGQTRHAWRETAGRLAAHGWVVITVDARGHGDSDWAPPEGYTLEALVEDVAQVAGTLTDPVIVGASMGGMTALMAQAEYGIARALVLVDIAPQVKPSGADRILDFMAEHRSGFATLDEASAAIAAFNPNRPRPSSAEGLRKNLRQHRDGRWYWHWDPQLLSLMADPAAIPDTLHRLDAAAGRISAPTLLLRGEHSDIIDDQSVDHLLRRIPAARTSTVRDTGHMIVGDDNDVFTAELLNFLDDLPPTDPRLRVDGRV